MESDVASRKLFIGGLSYGTDDDKLKSYFEQYGSVQDAVVMKDPVTRRSRGFGFITYTQQSFVDQALSAGVHVIDSRKVEAKRAVPRHEVVRDQISPTTTTTTSSSTTTTTTNTTTKSLNNNSHNHNNNHHHQQQNLNGNNYQIGNSQQQQQQYHNELHVNSDEYAYCKIFVGGLHYDTRDGEFRNYFEKYGRVISAEVMFNRETHKSRGFGFIIFDNEESVDRVCDEKDHSIDGKTVEVKRAVPRSKIGLMTSATTNATTNTTNSNSTIGTTNSNDNDNGNNNFNNLAAFPPVSPLNKNTTSTNNVQNITSSSNSNGQKSNSNTSGNLVNNNNNNNNNNVNVNSNNVNNNNSNNNNSSSSQVKKITPGTPPTSYAAVVISGPNANASNSSQQNSPQIQPITQSPSFGPIGSPTNASNSNSSFGMMLPPLHSSNNIINNNNSGSNNNLNSMSGTNSLNNSTHGNNSYIQSPYRSHSSSISDLSEPYQNHQNHYHHQQQQIQQIQHQNKSGVLLQHQEQFPPPSSPLRSMTSNYPPLTNQSYFQYPQLSIPNPSHARNRALSESFLFMPPSKSFQLSLGIMTPSPDLPYPPLLPSNLDSTNEVFEENSPDKVNDFNIQLSSENTQTDDDILGNSSWSPSKLSSLSGNKEVQLENLFSSNRQDIERSVSLGGLGWMPSSLSTHNFPPPQSRRGFSDLGVGIGFGHENSERDIGYGFGLPDLNDINHHQMQQQQQQQQQQFQYQQQQMQIQQQQIQMQQQQQLQQLNNSSFVPSMSAWESFLDQATNGQNISPSRPHSYSLNNLHDGLSPSRHYHSNMNINLNHSIHYNTQNNSQSTTTTSNSILNNGVDENDDNSYCIQELRLQAPEYTPNNIQPSSSSTSSSPWLSR